MRRPILPALLASVLFLGACSNTAEEEPAPAPAPGGDGAMPSVEGEFGAEPTITYPDGDPSGELEVEVLEDGDGAEVEPGDILVADYIGQVWDADTFDNSFIRDEPATFPIGVGMVIKGWDDGLVGQKIGSRVMLSIPSELGYAEGNPGAGIEPGDTIFFVVDIIDTYGVTDAGDPEAKVVDEAVAEMPVEIEGELGEPVTVSVKDDAPVPTEPVTTVLAEGNGAEVEPGTTALHFAIAVWDGQEGASTWEDEQVASMNLGDGSTPFDGLIGIPVGSRALIELPAGGGAEPMAIVVDVIGQPRR